MSNKEKIDYSRRNSARFLKMLAIQVVVMGQENWHGLDEVVHDDRRLPFLAGLTHKDYVDGPNLWPAISDPETLLQFVVMTEGFSDGLEKIRAVFANSMGSILTVSRHNTSTEELRAIKSQRTADSAVVLYLTGNRLLTSPLKPGFQLMMEEDDALYPFVNLSDTKPSFPSGSTFYQNVSQVAQRVLLNRMKSTEFLYLLKPITKEAIEEMREWKRGKEGREEILKKMEIIRSYGVLKMALELSLSGTNPLINNIENIPLLLRSQQILSEHNDRLLWLVEKGYLDFDEVKLLLALNITSSPDNEK